MGLVQLKEKEKCSRVIVRAATSFDRQAWDEYVTGGKNASFYHLYAWNEIFREAFGCETCYLVAVAGRRIVGVLPLFIIRNFILGGNYISSLPGGVCADDADTGQKLIQAAIELVNKRDASYLKLRDGFQRWEDNRLKTQIEYTYILDDLSFNPDVIWKAVKAGGRTRVRKARREGLVTVWGTEHLDSFYRVYSTNMRDLGTPAIPKPFFERSVREFPNNVKLLTVHLANYVIGGMYLFAFNGILYNPFVSSLRSYFQLCPNDLLYWEAITYACEHGYRALDLGRSAVDSGHARFKEKFLARPEKLFYQYYLNKTKTVPTNRGGQSHKIVSTVWKHLPLAVTNGLSPIIRRMIPLG